MFMHSKSATKYGGWLKRIVDEVVAHQTVVRTNTVPSNRFSCELTTPSSSSSSSSIVMTRCIPSIATIATSKSRSTATNVRKFQFRQRFRLAAGVYRSQTMSSLREKRQRWRTVSMRINLLDSTIKYSTIDIIRKHLLDEQDDVSNLLLTTTIPGSDRSDQTTDTSSENAKFKARVKYVKSSQY
ncbi:hypothetical protein LXL04_019627 [Taraxacum kok-saghyz]